MRWAAEWVRRNDTRRTPIQTAIGRFRRFGAEEYASLAIGDKGSNCGLPD